ncbi:hypothetical protein [Sorangium cellulosum]|uniref:Uncharacterized protein n=1 Tax=Sorangium cellulosum So0157-2 TaxID=1254432 RepID=S4Y5U1_SORCE|nr:hypothetical protein [Sorangium cellulosum]AGP39821.1 hypothetical protein SCE1572_38205 [Sorangium cellulosum So0157-2]
MALILGAAAFSAGCGDDSEGGGGTTASSTSVTSGTTGTGGAGGEGGSNEGGSNEGGAGTECVTCSAPLLGDDDPADLCESSVDEYEAVTTCICMECGAAEGDPCFDSCAGTAEQPSEECTACGVAAALTDGGACKAEGDACAADTGE